MKTSVDEYIARLKEIQDTTSAKLAMLPEDEPRFIIDSNLRTITIPDDFTFLGVLNDTTFETLYFEIDRYYDTYDLSEHTCVVQYMTTDTNGDILAQGMYAPDKIDITTVDGKLIFGWTIKSEVTRYAATVNFAIRFYTLETVNDNVTFAFCLNTVPSSLPVLDTLNVSETIASQYPEILEEWMEFIKSVEVSETARSEAESIRIENENTRIASENSRNDAEAIRVSNENIRIANEEARKTAESNRVKAESVRVTAETNRASAESTRQANETSRKSAEADRIANETARQNAESDRSDAEAARAEAETMRETAETSREEAESGRVDAENARVLAEQEREEAFANLTADEITALEDRLSQLEYMLVHNDIYAALAADDSSILQADDSSALVADWKICNC